MTRPADLVLGLDGGGTKTLVAVADRDGDLHTVRRGAALDPFSDPAWPHALKTLLGSVASLNGHVAHAVLGLPCYGEVTSLSLEQCEVARQVLTGPHTVVNDVEAAFDGALAGAPGILLLAGTGSMAWAGDGRHTIRCGGWGDMFGDEGSAFSIGREALGEVSRALDGRSRNGAFAERLLDLLGIEPAELLAWCVNLKARRTAVAALSFDVDTLAESGEPTACAILGRAADALAAHADACVRRLGLPPDAVWSFAGSVFHSRTVLARVTERIGRPPTLPHLPPLGGALLNAARRAGWTVDGPWIERLGRALSEADLRIAEHA